MMARFLRRLLVEDQAGATAIEYGFLACLISVAIIASLNTLSNSLNNTLNKSSNSMTIQP
jgi:pilus assembly protein Flp/PilA